LFKEIPSLNRAIKESENRLSVKLGENVSIVVRHFLTESIISRLVEIDHEKFRSELWYNSKELIDKTRKKDYVCLLLYVSSKPTAFLYGYGDENNPNWFFLDEIATKVEGKGIGKTLIRLVQAYCYELGYHQIVLYTEDQDEKGRMLRQFYQSLGFIYMYTDPEKGVVMNYSVISPASAQIH